jgi:hypothetical protein
MSANPADGELQFDTVTPPPLPGAADAAVPAGVSCTLCKSSIGDEYFDVNGQPICRVCRVRVLNEIETPVGGGAVLRALACGVVAAIAGAILYYAVIAITDFEIGIVAIAIGYMVGYAVRFGARGRGGRRFQVMAVALTYVAVCLAYAVLAFSAAGQEEAADANGAAAPQAQASSSAPGAQAAEPAGDPAEEAAPAAEEEAPGAGALVMLFGFVLALPIMVVVGSLPGGLISGAIIAFGMMQAWKMTMAPVLSVTGPYRVGAEASEAVVV